MSSEVEVLENLCSGYKDLLHGLGYFYSSGHPVVLTASSGLLVRLSLSLPKKNMYVLSERHMFYSVPVVLRSGGEGRMGGALTVRVHI